MWRPPHRVSAWLAPHSAEPGQRPSRHRVISQPASLSPSGQGVHTVVLRHLSTSPLVSSPCPKHSYLVFKSLLLQEACLVSPQGLCSALGPSPQPPGLPQTRPRKAVRAGHGFQGSIGRRAGHTAGMLAFKTPQGKEPRQPGRETGTHVPRAPEPTAARVAGRS